MRYTYDERIEKWVVLIGDVVVYADSDEQVVLDYVMKKKHKHTPLSEAS